MSTASLPSSYASSCQGSGMSVGVDSTAGVPPALRGLRGSVLAKGIRGAQLVPSFKLGCDSESAFGRVKSVAVCTGIDLVRGEGGTPRAVATASVRPNPALNRSAVSGFGFRLVGQRARLAQLQGLPQIFNHR
jgi:hypothetical protein